MTIILKLFQTLIEFDNPITMPQGIRDTNVNHTSKKFPTIIHYGQGHNKWFTAEGRLLFAVFICRLCNSDFDATEKVPACNIRNSVNTCSINVLAKFYMKEKNELSLLLKRNKVKYFKTSLVCVTIWNNTSSTSSSWSQFLSVSSLSAIRLAILYCFTYNIRVYH